MIATRQGMVNETTRTPYKALRVKSETVRRTIGLPLRNNGFNLFGALVATFNASQFSARAPTGKNIWPENLFTVVHGTIRIERRY